MASPRRMLFWIPSDSRNVAPPDPVPTPLDPRVNLASAHTSCRTLIARLRARIDAIGRESAPSHWSRQKSPPRKERARRVIIPLIPTEVRGMHVPDTASITARARGPTTMGPAAVTEAVSAQADVQRPSSRKVSAPRDARPVPAASSPRPRLGPHGSLWLARLPVTCFADASAARGRREGGGRRGAIAPRGVTGGIHGSWSPDRRSNGPRDPALGPRASAPSRPRARCFVPLSRGDAHMICRLCFFATEPNPSVDPA